MARFDEAYYAKHYFDPATAVSDDDSVDRLAKLVCAYSEMLEIVIETVLDLGCGIGLWRSALNRYLLDCDYTGVEISEVMCREYGWIRGSVVDFTPTEPADLVICQGVLQYLDDAQAEKAIANLGACTAGMLYLEVLTKRDWEEAVDQSLTDGDVNLRTGAWYKERLAQHFIACGGGVFVAKDQGAILYELERC